MSHPTPIAVKFQKCTTNPRLVDVTFFVISLEQEVTTRVPREEAIQWFERWVNTVDDVRTNLTCTTTHDTLYVEEDR